MAVLFVGVAASSAFQDARDVQPAARPDARRSAATRSPTCGRRRPRGGAQRPAREDRPRRRSSTSRATASASRRCAPSAATSRRGDPSLGPVSRFFEGEATSEVGLRAGLRRDFWTRGRARHRELRRAGRRGRPRLRRAPRTLPAAAARGRARRGARRPRRRAYRERPAAGDLPPDRLAAGDVDLDRRADRLRGRPDRAVAGARRRRAPARAAGLRGARGARARPRLSVRRRWTSSLAGRRRAARVVVFVVSGAAARAGARARGARVARERADARGGQGGQVPRDPRRRARPPHRQAVREDWRALDRELRAEAIEILRQLDALGRLARNPPTSGRRTRVGPGMKRLLALWALLSLVFGAARGARRPRSTASMSPITARRCSRARYLIRQGRRRLQRHEVRQGAPGRQPQARQAERPPAAARAADDLHVRALQRPPRGLLALSSRAPPGGNAGDRVPAEVEANQRARQPQRQAALEDVQGRRHAPRYFVLVSDGAQPVACANLKGQAREARLQARSRSTRGPSRAASNAPKTHLGASGQSRTARARTKGKPKQGALAARRGCKRPAGEHKRSNREGGEPARRREFTDGHVNGAA